jgi:hypothetical protein
MKGSELILVMCVCIGAVLLLVGFYLFVAWLAGH